MHDLPPWGLPFAFGPFLTGRIRAHPEDFLVEETLPFTPSGEGGHTYLWVEKRDITTIEAAIALASFAGLPFREVGFAGLKDRRAIARQWFSLPGRADWSAFAAPDLRIRHVTRHPRKLRRGAVGGNRFTLRVRHIQGDLEALPGRLAFIRRQGVPNYFGEQRFGHKGENLAKARRLFEGRLEDRKRRGFYLSAARSYLFNKVLALRVERGCWELPLPGDVMMLDGCRSVFPLERMDEGILERIRAMDIHPTAPLWGKGVPKSQGACLRLEEEALSGWEAWKEGLEAAGMRQERRSARLKVAGLRWDLQGDTLGLRFSLPAGGFATAVLREIVRYEALISSEGAGGSGSR